MRFCLTMCLALLVTIGYTQQCNYTLSGHIIDKDINTSLPNAVVEIVELHKTIVADTMGNFLFINICKGTYTIKVSHIGCETYVQQWIVDKNIHIDVAMPHSLTVGGEAVVTAIRERQNTGIRKELNVAALSVTRGENLAVVLSKLNGVTMLQTGSTVSKPVVYGLFGNRLLLINNGVRQEGQQWGNEHAPEVDPFLADKITVLKGVDELRYGSDAIGGVILVDPKPLRSVPGKSLHIFKGYATNNKLYYASAQYDKQLANKPTISYRLQGTYRRGANSTTPTYRLNNTGLQEYNMSAAIRKLGKRVTTDFFMSHFYTKLGIFTGSHIGNITDLQNAIAAQKPNAIFINQQTYTIARPRQEVNHQIGKLKWSWANKESQKRNILLAAQRNQRKEFDIVRNNSNTTPQLNLTVATFSQEINMEHSYIKNSSGTIGAVATQQTNDYNGRYFIPNYFAITNGVYALQKWMQPKWEYQAGVRADFKYVQTNRLKFNGQQVNYDFKFPTLAASFNATRKFNQHIKTNFAFALSSRAPYVNELLSDGIHHGTATYELGNINLQTEKSLFTAWNWYIQSHNNKIQVEWSLHNNIINDFIYQQPKPNEPVLTIAGAFPKINWVQTNAILTGSDFSMQYSINKQLVLTHKNAVLFARNRTDKDWLILMPANRMENTLTYSIAQKGVLQNAKFWTTLQSVATQKRVPNKQGIKTDFKEPPKGYQLVHIGAEATLLLYKKPVQFIIMVHNVANTGYRDYMNTFRYFTDEVGRNFSIKINYTLFNN